MWRCLVVTVALMACSSCANVTTMKIRQAADGSISIDSGKDVKADQIYFKRADEIFFVQGYSSAANVDAVNAQGNREVNLTNAVADAILKAVAAGAGVMKP